jgi:ubiquitin-protein ligase
MGPRDRRLLSDLRGMEQLAEQGQLTFRTEGNPPQTYHVMLSAPGLAPAAGGLTVRNLHRFDLYLHREYPRRPPIVTWLTPVFHPNLLGPERNGGVCIGSWNSAESLDDLCLRIDALVRYRSFNAADALNRAAAVWVTEHGVQPGVSVDQLAAIPLAPEPVVAAVSA